MVYGELFFFFCSVFGLFMVCTETGSFCIGILVVRACQFFTILLHYFIRIRVIFTVRSLLRVCAFGSLLPVRALPALCVVLGFLCCLFCYFIFRFFFLFVIFFGPLFVCLILDGYVVAHSFSCLPVLLLFARSAGAVC